jgi:hypothetical protein
LPPRAGTISVEDLFAAGMLRRVSRFRLACGTVEGGIAPRATEIPVAALNSLVNRPRAPLARCGVVQDIARDHAADLLFDGRPRFARACGVVDEDNIYAVLVLLPLCDQQGEIAECFVAVSSESGDAATGLLDELLTRDIDEE